MILAGERGSGKSTLARSALEYLTLENELSVEQESLTLTVTLTITVTVTLTLTVTVTLTLIAGESW